MNWDKVKEAIGATAPLLGGILGGPVGASAGTLISSVLGTKPTPEAILQEIEQNPEALLKIKELELSHKQKLEELKIREMEIEQEKYSKAHDSYQKNNNMADKIAQLVINWNLPVIFILVVINVYIVYKFEDNAPLISIVSNVIGIAIGKLFTERQAVINFFFGSSIGSKEKDFQISNMKK